MTTLEKIRAEIEQLENACSKEHGCSAEVLQVIDKYAQIFDKYAEQELTNQCDLCKFNTKLMLIEANVSGYAQGLKEPSKAEQNLSRDIKEIAEVIKSDVDAETKCKMISNILTAKPHYFEEQPRESEG